MESNYNDPVEKFYASAMELTRDMILKLDDVAPGGNLHNVVTGLERHCYMVAMVEENPPDVTYQVYYINNDNNLTGLVMQQKIRDPDQDRLLFLFAQFVSEDYRNLDPVNVFNTLQRQTRSMAEKLNYLTVSVATDLKGYQDPVILAPFARGIIDLSYIDKESFYRQYLGFEEKLPKLKDHTFVYMMLNKRNDLIKIGKSDNPRYREKTLSADEPQIFLIGCWNVPAKIEKDLHALFKTKRKRGEWFDLDINDLKKAKQLLQTAVAPSDL